MKNKHVSALLLLMASICYFISTWLTVSEGVVTGYRFYLQLISAVLFLFASIRIYMKIRLEKADQRDIQSE